MPIDPPDSEFDCIGVNGEGSYYKAVVDGVIDVVGWIMLEPWNVPESATDRVIYNSA